MTAPLPIVELRDLVKTFPRGCNGDVLTVLRDFSLRIESHEGGSPRGSGQFVALLGPSGCGKSTVLGLISGAIAPDRGEVEVLGHKVVGPHLYTATVPQTYTCFPWLSALQNVAFGVRLQRKGQAERAKIAQEYLEKVGLSDFPDAKPDELSGGMKQRVAIARALAMRRPILLMDEPFGALDAQTRADMQQMLLKLWQVEANTIIFVTHDITEALLLAQRVLVLSARPANIIHDLLVPLPTVRPPEIVYTADFIQCAGELRRLVQPRRFPANTRSEECRP